MRMILLVSALFALVLSTATADATAHVTIDLSRQRMHVESSEGSYDWPISSARSGFSTPDGSFAPTHLESMHYSRKYHMSPMPHAIFFRGGYAIHGTYSTGSLGRPASHGCVRLSPGNAARLYNMVKAEGARISISGTPPSSPTYARRRVHYASRAEAEAYRSDDATVDHGYGDAPYPAFRRARRAYRGYGYGESRGNGYAYELPRGYGYRPAYTYAPVYLSPYQGGYGYRQPSFVPGYD